MSDKPAGIYLSWKWLTTGGVSLVLSLAAGGAAVNAYFEQRVRTIYYQLERCSAVEVLRAAGPSGDEEKDALRAQIITSAGDCD